MAETRLANDFAGLVVQHAELILPLPFGEGIRSDIQCARYRGIDVVLGALHTDTLAAILSKGSSRVFLELLEALILA